MIIERAIDAHAAQMLRALNTETSKFAQLHRRFFDEVVAPILTSVASNVTDDLDPVSTSRRIVDLVFAGLAPRR